MRYDVAILGAGYAGLMAALRFSAWTSQLKAVLISESSHFIERVRLQESIEAPVAPRLPPLDRWLSNSRLDFIVGRIAELQPDAGTVGIEAAGEFRHIAYQRCIYALGSFVNVRGVPGAADHAFRLDPGAGPRAAAALRERVRSARLGSSVVIVGGGNSAVEAAAEVKAARPDLEVSVIAAGRVGDFEKGAEVERAVRTLLAGQDIRMMDHGQVREVRSDRVITEEGRSIAADLCVWAGGLRSPGIAAAAGLAVDENNRLWVDGALRSISHPQILAVGDAARPLTPTGSSYRQSAFVALTSGAYAARFVLWEAQGKRPRPFSFSSYGQGVAIGKRGIGFLTYPDDGDGYLVLAGPFALRIRNLFVRALIWFLRMERFCPGLGLFWIGRRRVNWSQANSALAGELPRITPINQLKSRRTIGVKRTTPQH
jgi:NADH dehydrogenase FAD-containing subunit